MRRPGARLREHIMNFEGFSKVVTSVYNMRCCCTPDSKQLKPLDRLYYRLCNKRRIIREDVVSISLNENQTRLMRYAVENY